MVSHAGLKEHVPSSSSFSFLCPLPCFSPAFAAWTLLTIILSRAQAQVLKERGWPPPISKFSVCYIETKILIPYLRVDNQLKLSGW